MDSTSIGTLALIGLLAVFLGWAAYRVGRRYSGRERTRALKERFGAEYEHAVAERGSVAAAERELGQRRRRMGRYHLRRLMDDERAEFTRDFRDVQVAFVEDPTTALRAAEALVQRAMKALGYPDTEPAQRLADLSVHHAAAVQHYRAARALGLSPGGGPSTEDQRQALVHYRAVFAELVGEPAPAPLSRTQESHA